MSHRILVTNDDGIHAKGIRKLASLMAGFGEVYVVAPDAARSGAGCSITSAQPVEVRHVEDAGNIHYYTCSGTPADCVKMACGRILPAPAHLLVSGINHGDNASTSIFYSGTMGAVFEGCLKGIPSIAFSLCSSSKDPDFAPFQSFVVKITSHVLQHPLPQGICLNVNLPKVDAPRGIKVTRLAQGLWETEWIPTGQQNGKQSFSLSGKFRNMEPESTDTDCWALAQGYVSVTPIHTHLTAMQYMGDLKDLSEEL